MKKLLFMIVLIMGCACYSMSQTASIKGTVIDTSENKNLANAVVALLRKSDSVLVKFTRTDKNGNFSLTKLPDGAFFILVTHPFYADYFEDAVLKPGAELAVNKVPMITRAQLLEEVIVKQQLGAIRMKKDTTEFIADSFKVAANANVEDLLRRLPGFQIDKDGKITAQGEQVQKVLVDGEEFFGNDPTVATQNIRADNVEKVQVYDKKSDQATFSGIDDGERTKTVNLKLKDSKKNGFFGKATVGGGLPDKFQNEAMINAFKGKRKIAAFGTMANTGKTGLSWTDSDNYSDGNGLIEIEDGSGNFMSGSNEFGSGGAFYGEGLPTGWSGGVHYSNKYNDAKNSLNGSYRFNKLNTLGGGRTTSQFLLPDTLYYRNELGETRQQRMRNLMSGILEVQLDSFTSIKVTANGSIGKSEQFNSTYAESLSEEQEKVNESTRSTISSGDNENLTTTALFRKRFKKPGRTMSVTFNQTYNKNQTDGFLYSDNLFFNADGSTRTRDSINQQKRNAGNSLTLAGKVVLTEAVSKSMFIELNYSLANSDSRNERITLGSVNGKYENYIDSLSTDYDFNVLTNRGGLSWRYNKKKVNISVGSDISSSNFRQKDLLQDTSLSYRFVNLFPRANLSYSFGPQRRLRVYYNGSTRQPTINQLQPLRDNTDPLNIYRGNPDLKQEFRNNFSINFSDFKVLNNQYLYANVNTNLLDNAISTSEIFDYDLGKRIYQPVNVNGNYSVNASVGYSFKPKKVDVNLNFRLNGGISENNSIVNLQKNTNSNRNYGGGFGINYFKKKKIIVNLYSDIRRNTSNSSIRKEIETKYWTADIYPSFTIYLPGKFEISTDANISLREKTAVFDRDLNVIKWNGRIAKKFLKTDALELRAEVRDILDQNIGFNRNISNTNITERTYDTLRRFWLVSLTYHFSKNGKPPANPWD